MHDGSITHPMLDSDIDIGWLKQACADFPPGEVLDDRGQPTGGYSSGIVRLMFPRLFEPAARESGGTPVYSVALLFPPDDISEVSRLVDIAESRAKTAFPEDNRNGRLVGVKLPFHEQDDNVGVYPGFTPGCKYVNVSRAFEPQVFDNQLKPVTDPGAVYPGVWAMVYLSAYTYSKKSKGMHFGLTSVMLVADDLKLRTSKDSSKNAFRKAPIRPPVRNPQANFSKAPPKNVKCPDCGESIPWGCTHCPTCGVVTEYGDIPY